MAKSIIYTPVIEQIGNQEIRLRENHDLRVHFEGSEAIKKYHSIFEVALRYCATSEGVFRAGQLFERTSRFINATLQSLNYARITACDACADKMLTAWTWGTTFLRLPSVTKNAVESVRALDGSTEGQPAHQARHKFQKAFADGGQHSILLIQGVFIAPGSGVRNRMMFMIFDDFFMGVSQDRKFRPGILHFFSV